MSQQGTGDAVVLADGVQLTIRPMRPDDRERYLRAFHRLSTTTLYRRFGGAKRELSDTEVERFLVVDDTHLVLVATEPDEGEIVAVARVAPFPDQPGVGDVGIVVGDRWQGRGLGAELLTRLVDSARASGFERLVASSMIDNLPIGTLLRRSGFRRLSSSFGTAEWEMALASSVDGDDDGAQSGTRRRS
ncbi:MAG: GNAT family N-acetyltransferase [Acidimicrobiales bacterium]